MPPTTSPEAGERIAVEIFHDVLCAFCYALSPRLHRLADTHPEIEVVHRSFALAPSPARLSAMFGSPEAAKSEILEHWRRANELDDERRIDADLMATRDHPYPHSMPGLIACKAAEAQGGQDAHWAMLDAVQRAHLTDCLDITDPEVLAGCGAGAGLDVDRWQADVADPETRRLVEEDLARAEAYGIGGVPTLVAAGRYGLSGAQPLDVLEQWLTAVKERLAEEKS